MQHQLIINDLHASVNGEEILTGVDLTVRSGEMHALMVPEMVGEARIEEVQ